MCYNINKEKMSQIPKYNSMRGVFLGGQFCIFIFWISLELLAYCQDLWESSSADLI